jgi:hypothetical protein
MIAGGEVRVTSGPTAGATNADKRCALPPNKSLKRTRERQSAKLKHRAAR